MNGIYVHNVFCSIYAVTSAITQLHYYASGLLMIPTVNYEPLQHHQPHINKLVFTVY